MRTHIESLLHAVVVVAVEEAVHVLRLVATQQLYVALHHVRRRTQLLLAHLPEGGTDRGMGRERGGGGGGRESGREVLKHKRQQSGSMSDSLWVEDALQEGKLQLWCGLQSVRDL